MHSKNSLVGIDENGPVATFLVQLDGQLLPNRNRALGFIPKKGGIENVAGSAEWG